MIKIHAMFSKLHAGQDIEFEYLGLQNLFSFLRFDF